jgi:ribosomal protein L16 Arg81 hydroxylase
LNHIIISSNPTSCANVKDQLIVGPPRSAAHFHFHQDAFNLLYVGTKRWLLRSPADRHVSRQHLTDWLAAGGVGPRMECTQQAGDMMYVPHMWTHAVANIQDSVALAVEFSECELGLLPAYGWGE